MDGSNFSTGIIQTRGVQDEQSEAEGLQIIRQSIEAALRRNPSGGTAWRTAGQLEIRRAPDALQHHCQTKEHDCQFLSINSGASDLVTKLEAALRRAKLYNPAQGIFEAGVLKTPGPNGIIATQNGVQKLESYLEQNPQPDISAITRRG